MLAVANREGGYSYEQLEDLEAIAPAVLQALHRIKAEKSLHDAYEQIHVQADELQIQSEDLQRMNETLEERVKERTSELEKAYNCLKEIETVRKQEIHHRIKNNLQVISSLLDLQAEQFKNKECIKDSEVLEAFRESQAKVISMALIHEELHKRRGFDTLNFSSYIEKLIDNLFLTYRLENTDVSLKIDLKKDIFFDMDTAIPLGMIMNELVTNSLKYAFIGRDKGEIRIKLSGGRSENI